MAGNTGGCVSPGGTASSVVVQSVHVRIPTWTPSYPFALRMAFREQQRPLCTDRLDEV